MKRGTLILFVAILCGCGASGTEDSLGNPGVESNHRILLGVIKDSYRELHGASYLHISSHNQSIDLSFRLPSNTSEVLKIEILEKESGTVLLTKPGSGFTNDETGLRQGFFSASNLGPTVPPSHTAMSSISLLLKAGKADLRVFYKIADNVDEQIGSGRIGARAFTVSQRTDDPDVQIGDSPLPLMNCNELADSIQIAIPITVKPGCKVTSVSIGSRDLNVPKPNVAVKQELQTLFIGTGSTETSTILVVTLTTRSSTLDISTNPSFQRAMDMLINGDSVLTVSYLKNGVSAPKISFPIEPVP